ncbi:MAG: T9SS type A sorting domain-containing protein [Winogradskyella sp.]|nr:T9SS type A sorting domain-containing protein [Winogradskyella sp.]
MKRNYTLKILATAVFAIVFTLSVSAQVRILRLDPATNSVTLKNFGGSNEPISGLWLCNFPAYGQVSSMTAVTSLDPGEEVSFGSSVNFAPADGEFGLYTSASFASSAAMIDYMQWGSAGHQRESVAVAAGVWDVGTFINVAPPFEYTGDGSENGVAFWSTLGVNEFEQGNSLRLYPNPSNSILNIEFNSAITEGAIEIFDILGKQVFIQSIVSNNLAQIDVADWETGLYIVKISSESGEETKRFVKQ